MGVICTMKSVSMWTERGFRNINITAGCGGSVALVIQRGECLAALGFSGWSADITCPSCRARLGLPVLP